MSSKNLMFQKDKPPVRRGASMTNGTMFKFSMKPNAKKVYLVGEFNNWDPQSHRMVKKKGEFVKMLRLKPGEYQYKFLVDGEWLEDPAASKQVLNEFGTKNSVVRVEKPGD